MTQEQIERLREWHKRNFNFLSVEELANCLIVLNVVLNTKLDIGKRSENTRQSICKKIYLNGELISEVKK